MPEHKPLFQVCVVKCNEALTRLPPTYIGTIRKVLITCR
jgi:hypothetical protein